MEMGKISEKVALVTGAASGIGRAISETLANEGAHVVVADVNESGARETARVIGDGALFQYLDVTNENDWQTAISMASERFGGLDILVNSAGIGIMGDVEETLLEDWNRVIGVNLTGTFLGCKHAIRAMKINGGAIVNICSVAGIVGFEDLAAYAASKGGVTTFTKSVALNVAAKGYGIRVNSINPTYVDTPILDEAAEAFESREVMIAGMAEMIPIGRLATAQDIADAALFLVSDSASMITGTYINVDGGTTAGLPSRHTTNQ